LHNVPVSHLENNKFQMSSSFQNVVSNAHCNMTSLPCPTRLLTTIVLCCRGCFVDYIA